MGNPLQVRQELPRSAEPQTKKNADYVFYELTRSICPNCRKVIDAQIILRDNKVFKPFKLPLAVALLLTFAATANAAGQAPAAHKVPTQSKTGEYRYTNRLIHAKSPYLLLHAHNPVDWYSWGDEAFEKARKENKPIFLSIGYFTCHWCHVMEKESYSDPTVAAILNKYFVSIKVDREERPDIDRLYIAYVEATTGSAGWPLNVLLTPDRKPFFGGTYFPPDQLKPLLQKVADAWDKQHDSITQTAGRAAEQLIQIVSKQPPATGALQPAILDQAYKQIASTYPPRGSALLQPPTSGPAAPCGDHLGFFLPKRSDPLCRRPVAPWSLYSVQRTSKTLDVFGGWENAHHEDFGRRRGSGIARYCHWKTL